MRTILTRDLGRTWKLSVVACNDRGKLAAIFNQVSILRVEAAVEGRHWNREASIRTPRSGK
jgi:hypothetical protein